MGLSSPSWVPSDFIQRRTFCPAQVVQETLDGYRSASQANVVLLLAYDEKAVLKSLTMVSAESAPVQQRLAEQAAEAPETRRMVTTSQNPFWRTLSTANISEVLEQASDSAQTFLGHSANFYSEVADLGRRHDRWLLDALLNPDERSGVEILILRLGGHRPGDHQRRRDQLKTQINATVNASMYRNAVVNSEVDRSLSAKLTTHERSEGTVGELVKLVREITYSAGAALFVYDPAGYPTPTLVARHPVFGAGVELANGAYPTRDPHSMSSLVFAAFAKRRTLLTGIPNGRDLGGLAGAWVSTLGALTEVAVPIPEAPGGPSTPSSGVLSLCVPSDRHYADYDLALIGNVGLRIALLNMSTNTAQMASRVTRSLSPLIRGRDVHDTHQTKGESIGASARVADLPTDLAEAVEGSLPVLAGTAATMGANSGTIRLVVLRVSGKRLIYELRRVAAWPGSKLSTTAEVLPIDDHSVNGWAAKHGQAVNISNLQDRASLRPYRGLVPMQISGRHTRAEVCVPINLEGRLVGTLNFESPDVGTFSHLASLAEAAASQIAAQLLAVRRRHVRDILALSEDLQVSAHELIGLHGRIRTHLDHQPAEEPMSLLADSYKVLDDVIGSLEPRRPDQLVGRKPESLMDFVGSLLRTSHVQAEFNATSHEVSIDWSAPQRRRAELAFLEVFNNIAKNRPTNVFGTPWITTRAISLGGTKFAEVRIEQAISPTAEPAKLRDLYRVPVQKKDRVHFGALTAGVLMRSMGGEISVLPGKPGYLMLVVSLPTELE